MPSTTKRLALLPLLALAPLAHADPIMGKVAVGTWGTQAEFADVKVVQGTKRLFASNFEDGLKGWRITGGEWSTEGGVLRQTGGGRPAMATAGKVDWVDYTLTLRARKLGGDEGFLIGFGMPNDRAKSWWNVGGWGNTQDALEVPGVSMLPRPNAVVAGRWYAIRVEVRGSDVRCYLDGQKVVDTARVLDDAEWNDRRDQILASPGLARLPGWEADQVRELLGRPVFHGQAARARYDVLPGVETFRALDSAAQAALIRRVNRYRMTWVKGWGWGSEGWRDDEIENSMEGAVMHYNALGVFDKHLTANVSPGTPTADAGWDGGIRFGGSRNYRVALHEISHTLGNGTTGEFGGRVYDGYFHGTYTDLVMRSFGDAHLWSDGIHYWPYGMNYDDEYSDENARRQALAVAAFRRDCGFNGVLDSMYSTDVPDGIYRLTPRLAPGSALEATAGAAGAPLDIRADTGAAGQRFRMERQADGTYVLRSLLSGRCVDLPGGAADNGAQIQLWDENGLDPQRWYLIPTGDGWFKIAPKNNVWKTLDLWGVSPADGTPVKLWDFWDGFGQQFRLDRVD